MSRVGPYGKLNANMEDRKKKKEEEEKKRKEQEDAEMKRMYHATACRRTHLFPSEMTGTSEEKMDEVPDAMKNLNISISRQGCVEPQDLYTSEVARGPTPRPVGDHPQTSSEEQIEATPYPTIPKEQADRIDRELLRLKLKIAKEEDEKRQREKEELKKLRPKRGSFIYNIFLTNPNHTVSTSDDSNPNIESGATSVGPTPRTTAQAKESPQELNPSDLNKPPVGKSKVCSIM
ncbi:TPX2 domain-containing protein [Caenorhabditis elegans]|uniref:TPX2 domain-containing protein n=1 Tax=Caenorhabditis elegans TaxID=6239 RepID=Q20663_CAEEL|nr:TPX2 domain-containing protein [Caenorhabditis elegans]CCD70804.2 TPX2 domain-containing protein [Caenorhabditis elegans]|eukprot:NP_505168.2 Uncharacterized protein CELE_F52E1.3 [Caenorhabditis elegans]